MLEYTSLRFSYAHAAGFCFRPLEALRLLRRELHEQALARAGDLRCVRSVVRRGECQNLRRQRVRIVALGKQNILGTNAYVRRAGRGQACCVQRGWRLALVRREVESCLGIFQEGDRPQSVERTLFFDNNRHDGGMARPREKARAQVGRRNIDAARGSDLGAGDRLASLAAQLCRHDERVRCDTGDLFDLVAHIEAGEVFFLEPSMKKVERTPPVPTIQRRQGFVQQQQRGVGE